MLPPEVAESRLLSSLTSQADIAKCQRMGLTELAFSVYPEVWTFYRDYAREYGAVPLPADVVSQLGDSAPTYTEPGDLEYYAEEVLGNYTVSRVHAAIVDRLGPEGVKLQASPDEAARLLAEDLRRLARGAQQHVMWLDRDSMQRLEWLEEARKAQATGSVIGMPTGLRCFDDAKHGWEPGEAIMVMGPKGAGKSWIVTYFGTVAHFHDYKVLLLSPEMSVRQVALRFDVLLARLVGKQLSHSGLMVGTQEVQPYKEWLEGLSTKERFIAVDSAAAGGFTVSNTLGYIDEHKPDIAILDGIHLIGGEGRQSGWERIKEAADALKATAQRLGCTVVWTSQVDRGAMANPTEPAATGSSAAYGKAAVEAANRLITVGRFKGDAKRRTFKVPNNRSGPEFHATQHLAFDVDIGRIEQTIWEETPGEEAAF